MEDMNGGPRRHEALVCHLSPDGSRVSAVSWTWDKTQHEFVQITTWDARTGKVIARRPFRGHLSSCFAPDGGGVTVDSNESLTIEETTTGRVLARIWGDQGSPVDFSPDGTLVAVGIHETLPVPRGEPGSGWKQKGIRVAEVATGQELFHIEGQIDFAAFSPDGKVLATADPEALEVWDPLTGSRLFRRPWPTGLAPGPHYTPIGSLAFLPGETAVATGMNDGTVLVWDLAPQTWPATPNAKHVDGNDLDRLWSDLAGEDARKAHQAMHALAATPAQAILFLPNHLRPAVDVDPMRVQQLIAELDNNQFAVRTAASKELTTLGEAVEPALRQALDGKPSVELQRRIEALLAAMRTILPPETRRTIRAIRVLERIGTPDAERVLQKLATGAEPARETREAREALERRAKPARAMPSTSRSK